jgi:tetratricopeptide (TPR) repeat protein
VVCFCEEKAVRGVADQLIAKIRFFDRRFSVLAKAAKKKKVQVKDLKYSHDPMIRLYDRTQEWLQERARPFVIGIGVIAAALVLYLVGSYFFDSRRERAEAAFSEAVEKFNAQIVDPAVAPATTQAARTYVDPQTKWTESAEAFEKLANDYSGYYGAIGRYYAGVSYLHIDRNKGVAMLEGVVGMNEKPTSDLARLALAENCLGNGEAEKAVSLYQQLLGSADVLKPAVNLGLGRAYEKTGETEKAADAYFEAAKPDRASPVGAEAEKQLKRVAPGRMKDLPTPEGFPVQP